MNSEFKGLIACVTGGARGLGSAIAERLAKGGAKVIIADRLVEDGTSLVGQLSELNFHIQFLEHDVTSEESWSALTSKIESEFGRLDILINNAAIIIRKCLSEQSLDEWEKAMSVNVAGVFLGCKHCRNLLAKSEAPSIVNVSSTAGIIAHHDPSYTASKWAVRGLTKSLALELLKDNIRVNSVHPSTIATPLTDAAPEGHLEANRYAIPMGREARPQEIANIVAFLASRQSSYMTGSEVIADGGMTTAGVANMRNKFQQEFVEGKI